MKNRVLIIQPKLQEYRIPIFDILSKEFDLTILHSGREINIENKKINQIIFEEKWVGPFIIKKGISHEFLNQFDVIISEGNIRNIDRNLFALNPFRKYKWIFWSIGVSASYNKKFDQDNKLDFIRNFIFKFADGIIFYSDYPVNKYIKNRFNPKSLFVANNTTEVSFNEKLSFEKNSILFIGTLYRQKRIYELLESYKKASSIIENIMPLIIIGDGLEYNNIKKWIFDNELKTKIKLLGAIFSQKELEQYFRKAYACISPGQAGLSVLTSMGYGTPFITRKDAITGGEIFNIKNNINGILYNNDDELTDIIIEINYNNLKYLDLGIKAREFYIENRLPIHMVKGFSSAIKYSLLNSD